MCYLAFLQQIDAEVVEIGSFCRPVQRRQYAQGKISLTIGRSVCRNGNLLAGNFLSFLVGERETEIIRLSRTWIIARKRVLMLVTDHHTYFEVGIFEVVVEGGLRHYVVNPTFGGHGFECDIPIDAPQRPVIKDIELILPCHLSYTDGKPIDTVCLQFARSIKGKRGITAVMTTQVLPIQPYFG